VIPTCFGNNDTTLPNASCSTEQYESGADCTATPVLLIFLQPKRCVFASRELTRVLQRTYDDDLHFRASFFFSPLVLGTFGELSSSMGILHSNKAFTWAGMVFCALYSEAEGRAVALRLNYI